MKITSSFLLIGLTISTLAATLKFQWWDPSQQQNFTIIFFVILCSIVFRLTQLNLLNFLAIIFSIMIVGLEGISPLISLMVYWIIAYCLGDTVLKYLEPEAKLRSIYAPVIGFAIIGLAVTISSHFRINYLHLYFSCFIFLIYIYYDQIKKISAPIIFYEIKKINVIYLSFFILAMLYLFMVTVRPDLGHDGLSTHLVIPRKIFENQVWNFNINEFIWSILPMGSEMIYVPAYFFGGEDGVRLLNTSFLVATAYLIYRRATLWGITNNLAFALGLLILTLPLSFYVVSSTFVEPVAIFFTTYALSYLIERGASPIICAILFGYMCTLRISLITFAPLIFIPWIKNYKYGIGKNLIIPLVFLFIFGFINYIFAFYKTGNPFFPLLNHIFKSEYFELGVNYSSNWVNKDGILTPFFMILDSKKYGDIGLNGALGIFYLITTPILLIYIFLVTTRNKKLLVAFAFVLIFCGLILSIQSYLRYIYPILAFLIIIFSYVLNEKSFNLKLVHIILMICIGINLYKIPYAGPHFSLFDFKIYTNNQERKDYIIREMPYAYLGEIIRNIPEVKGKKILLIGPGFTPSYYNYPDKTVAFSWHSRQAFNSIVKELQSDSKNGLAEALKKLDVDYIVCPLAQGNSEDFLDKNLATNQCHEASTKIMDFNGIFFGKVNK